eukprot:TRINITY_DN50284_c0_g1_i1.p1 TRINITY_DN50284_c0_g1~~TRINITY_DN50284_c0_g1_i1.p1  ORF type:complete len:266 (+),score=94.42 TRINITY_DN50284_c0_g1_i1:191-988(+)
MGVCCAKPAKEERTRTPEVEASELFQLRLVSPVRCEVEAHALDTVEALLWIVGERIEEDRAALELVFSDAVVKDSGKTLQALGMCQDAAFEVTVTRVTPGEKKVPATIHDHVEAGSVQQVRRMLQESRQVVSQTTTYNVRPLHLAAEGDNAEVLQLLLEAKAEVDAKDKGERCALHYAIAQPGNTEALLLAKASPALTNKNGRTALHNAAQGGYLQTVRLLLQGKASPRAVDKSGHTALENVLRSANPDPAVVALLQQYKHEPIV